MVYKVKYRTRGQWFFRTLKRVKGDFIAGDVPGNPRVFILEDETRVEISTIGADFVFSPERWMQIKQKMEEEAGQAIKTKV